MKKLLILGGSLYENAIIERARKKGLYTIVTDMYSLEISPAKMNADEYWNISWSDIDKLEEKCRNVSIDGILAGFSEFRVENLIKLTQRLGLPCYCSVEQLEFTRDKEIFKRQCKKYCIPVVPDYSIEQTFSTNDFPIIVKPVDRGGSIGISVASTLDELKRSIDYALTNSPSKHIIIEKYMKDYIKFDVYYLILNGNYYFIGSSDTIMCKHANGAEVLQKAWVYPSKHEDKWLNQVDANIRKMFAGLGLKQGYITISAFTDGMQFYVFETGYRLSGELSYLYSEAKIGVNYIDSMIDFALKDNYSSIPIIPKENVYSLTLNYFGVDGVVDKIVGTDYINQCSDIKCYMRHINVGDAIHKKGLLNPYVTMIILISEDKGSLISSAMMINNEYDILDAEGKSLILEKMDYDEIVSSIMPL